MSKQMLRVTREKSIHPGDHPSNGIVVTYRPIASLKLDPRNPRVHTKQQIHQIAKSIKSFGFNVPVLVNSAAKIIAGHGRVQAAKEAGMREVPTICLDHLTEAQARAFMIADNRLTEIATWNEQLLSEQLKELSGLDLTFDMESTGFSMGEIDLRIQGLGVEEQSENPDDQIPANSGPPVAKAGDIWLLDRHRIACASALEEGGYSLLMPQGKRAAMAFTDPPYNVPINGHASGLGKIKHRDFVMAAGEMSRTQYCEFLTKAFVLMARSSTDGAVHFACADWRHMGEYLAAGEVAYTELKNVCVWVKDNAGMGSLYRSQHELVFVFKHGKAAHRNNVQLGRFGRSRANVWSYPGANTSSRTSEEGNLLALHPTVKPVKMVADAILDCSSRGDVVLDPFLGSGTTILAAERTGRAAYGLELDPRYVDVAIRRWQALTGGQAEHGMSGRTFNSLEKKVRHA